VPGLIGRAADEQAYQCRLDVAIGRIERVQALVRALPACLLQDHDRTAAQLGVARHHVDHQVGPGTAETHRDRRREAVQNELLRGGRLHPGGPGDHLRPGIGDDANVGELGQRCSRVGADECSGRADFPSPPQRPTDVRSSPAGRDADDDVGRLQLAEVRGTDSRVILNALDRGAQRDVASGVMRDDPPFVDAVRGCELGRVEHRHPATRAGAHVMQPAAGTNRVDRGVDEHGESGQARRHGSGNRGVLCVDHREQVDGRHLVDRERAPVALLGR
jgi:hypothetical protein